MSVTLAKISIYNYKEQTHLQELVIKENLTRIGRALDNNLVLSEAIVSRLHAEINKQGEEYFLQDLNSIDGTYLNGIRLKSSSSQPLKIGDVIRIGSFELSFSVERINESNRSPSLDQTMTAPATIIGLANEEITDIQELDLRGKNKITIGRDQQNQLVINHPAVSRSHAEINRKDGSFYINDLNSSNGTFVNGKQITEEKLLKVGDNIKIGSSRLTLNIDETIIRQNEEGKLSLDAIHLNKIVGKGVNLLNDISLSIKAREFVVVAGVSGGGKSTLLDALNGFRPATGGQVLVNGIDLYKNFNAYRTEIGYVPQKDIVHMELSIEQALDYAAQLRMPADTRIHERKQRIDEVLAELGLTHRRNVPIKALSGGQLKRVSIGVELLTKPSLFFLDEATSGLDPGTEADIMQLLRDLANQGRTILLITHATDNVMLCDLVVFLAAGGRIAYFGPPQEALNYFGVSKFNEIYPKVERQESPEYWQKKYLHSPQYQKYVLQRQSKLSTDEQQKGTHRLRQQKSGAKVRHVSSWQQLVILSQRNLSILMRDRASLILMLAIAPILGILDFFTWQRQLFNLQEGDAGQAITMLFTTALIAVMVGSLATMREIVKEQEIYRRERMIGLQVIPYVLSKVWVSIILALYQAAVFLIFKILAVDIPQSPEVLLAIYITLVLATIAGMMMGLLVSAISPNQNIAPLLTIIFLVPQITFGGGVLPVNSLGIPGQIINKMSLTKWPFESLVTITDLGTDVANDPCWQKTESEREKFTEDDKKLCDCLGTNLFQGCRFPGISAKYDPAIDAPQPAKPEDPGSPPPQPKKPDNPTPQAQKDYQESLDNYQEEIDNYQQKVDEYQDKIDEWQDKYSDWKGNYEGAIGEAEGIINRFHTDYGLMFNVNVIRHWLIESFLILVMFGLVLFIQKRKDII